jgi:hypothetical protein
VVDGKAGLLYGTRTIRSRSPSRIEGIDHGSGVLMERFDVRGKNLCTRGVAEPLAALPAGPCGLHSAFSVDISSDGVDRL